MCSACHDATRHSVSEGAPSPQSGPARSAGGVPEIPAVDEEIDEELESQAEEDNKPQVFSVLHEPVAQQKCLTCHRGHQSEHRSLLRKAERELCLGCHVDTAEQLGAFKHVHGPVASQCLSCHAGHGSETPKLLVRPDQDLCLGCHESIRETLVKYPKEVHGAIRLKRSCLWCHGGHGGETNALTASKLDVTCMRCHDRELKMRSGRRIANIAAELRDAKYVHGPVAVGDCDACHQPHTSPYTGLLARRLDAGEYVDFSEAAYELCFSCHEKSLFVAEKNAKTGFRDGERNLHRLHVVREKGRNCRLCHAFHASDTPRLIRSKASFGPGGWDLPIEVTMTETGGTCGPICHRATTYTRSPASRPGASARKPEENETKPEAGRQDTRAARADTSPHSREP